MYQISGHKYELTCPEISGQQSEKESLLLVSGMVGLKLSIRLPCK